MKNCQLTKSQLKKFEMFAVELSELLNKHGIDAYLNRADYILSEQVTDNLMSELIAQKKQNRLTRD